MENKINSEFLSVNDRDAKITDSLLIIYFLFLIIFPVVSIVALMVLVLYFLFTRKFKGTFRRIGSDRILLIFILYYLIHVIGMFYSSDLKYGFEDLETKLSFLIVPILFAGLNISKQTFERIKVTFILSSVISLIILLSVSAYHYSLSNDSGDFLYSQLSLRGHPTYISMYFNVAMLFILERYFKQRKWASLGLTAISFFFLFEGVLLLSSRTSTFVTILSVLIYPVLLKGRSFFQDKVWMIYVAFVIIMGSMFYNFLNFSNRFEQVKDEIKLRETGALPDTIKQEEPNSTNIRINIWKNAIQLIKRNPIFGVGTGDLKEELVNIYKENNYEYGVHKSPSPHNQYLHTTVILGIVGLIFLLAYLFIPFYLSFKQHDWLYFIFLLIIILNCLTESVLERQAGILFFTTFNVCFYLRMCKGDSKDKSIQSSNVSDN